MLFNSIVFSFFFLIVQTNFIQKELSTTEINYIISNIHAIGTLSFSILLLGEFITPEFYIELSSFSIGYAIYDIYFLKLTNSPNIKFLLMHHLMIIICNVWMNYYKDFFVIKIIAYNYLTEITTPFLNLSMYLYHTKKTDLTYKSINIFKVSNVLLLISFFTMRIMLGLYLIKTTFFYNILFLLQILMVGLNIHWFSRLIKKAFKIFN